MADEGVCRTVVECHLKRLSAGKKQLRGLEEQKLKVWSKKDSAVNLILLSLRGCGLLTSSLVPDSRENR